MPATRRPEVFISATSADLRSCRQLIKEALLTLHCVPVEQTNFPPDHRSVHEMLRARIIACDAIVHVAGEVYGYEPQERAPGEPRRSYTQMEYDIARELGKPVYVFVCSAGFPYDPHAPEDADKQQLQQAHRAVLSASETLRYDVHTRDELSLRVRELQTHVNHLKDELKKAHAWLGRGLAAGVALALVGGAGMWWLHMRGKENEAQVAVQMAAQQREIAELRTRLAKQSELTEAVLAKMNRGSSPAPEEDQRDPTLAAQTAVAAQRGIEVGELRKQLSAEGSDVRNIVSALEQRSAKSGAGRAEVQELQREAYLKLAQNELAAGHYETAAGALDSALSLATKTEQSVVWARIKSSYGSVLNSWAAVSTGKNIAERRRLSIAAHQAALEVYTRESYPQDWARTQNNLAEVLVSQALAAASVDRPRLLAEAVRACRAALEIYTKDDLPQDWARTQSNLAIALRNQAASAASAERAPLFAEAAVAYRAALEVYTRDALPEDWARTQSDLAIALIKQASSSASTARAHLLAEAVVACRAALEVLTRESFPRDWARTQGNLAVALSNQASAVAGADRARLLADAVDVFHLALAVFTRESYPQDWARTQSDLAITLRRQASAAASADRARLLAGVVGAYRSALFIYTREALPQDWGRTQNNLSVALMALATASPQGERAALLTDAVAASRASLEVVTRHSNAELWAIQKWTLGDALRALAEESSPGDRTKALTEAVAVYRVALEVFTEAAFPTQHADLAKELAAAEGKLAEAKATGR